jgi:hypothetical protein
VFATVATGPAIVVFAFGGSIGVRGLLPACRSAVFVFESGDKRECHEEFSIAGGELFGESRVCAC